MNREALLKISDIVEHMPHFDMIYPEYNLLGAIAIGFDRVAKDSYTNAGIVLGLRHNQVDELMFARSYNDMEVITKAHALVPAAIRYMVEHNDINWRRAMTAVMMDNALNKDKTNA